MEGRKGKGNKRREEKRREEKRREEKREKSSITSCRKYKDDPVATTLIVTSFH
jgi:hypothetical protein